MISVGRAAQGTTNAALETQCSREYEQLSEDLAAGDFVARTDNLESLKQIITRAQENLDGIDDLLRHVQAERNQATAGHGQEVKAEEVDDELPTNLKMEDDDEDMDLVIGPEPRLASQEDSLGRKDFQLHFTTLVY